MKNFFMLALLLSNVSVFAQSNPPATKETPTTDTYFGKSVVDNYRWLENLNDPAVQSWFKAQGEYTDNIMNKIPGRDSLVKEWLALDKLKPAVRRNISMHNNRYFYLMQKPEEKVGKLYYREGKNGKEILLFDPATFAGEKGKTYSINQFVENNDGSKVALCITEGGAEVGTIRIMNVATKKWYEESIYPTWTGITGWTKDGNSFLYYALQTGDQNAPEFLLNTKSKLHTVGTDPKTDKEIFSRQKYPETGAVPEDIVYSTFSEDYKYIISYLAGVQNEFHAFYALSSKISRACRSASSL